MYNTAEKKEFLDEKEILKEFDRGLLKRNPFRLFGLSIDAKQRDFDKKLEKIRLLTEFDASENTVLTPFPVTPPPDLDTLNESLNRLRDPRIRLLYELFWFWPVDSNTSKSDGALLAIKQGNIQGAIELWKGIENKTNGILATHNLAVFHLLKALDSEQIADRNTSRIKRDWQKALKRWRIILDSDSFWRTVKNRVKEVNDPRLTTGYTRNLRDQLPTVLLLIKASLAIRVAEKGQYDDAKSHMKLFRTSKFDKEVQAKATSYAITPVRERIKLLCQSVENDSKDKPEEGDQIANRLIEQTEGLLAVVNLVLEEHDPIRASLHDQIAAYGKSAVVAFGNETKNWKKSVTILETLLLVAVGESAKGEIEVAREVGKRNIQYAKDEKLEQHCFFCEKNKGHEDTNVEEKMYGDVNKKNYPNITWNTQTITVPRCKTCEAVHDKRGNAVFMWTFSGALFMLGLLILPNFEYLTGTTVVVVWVIPCLSLILLGLWIYLKTDLKIKGYSKRGTYPKIQALLERGWHIGSIPVY